MSWMNMPTIISAELFIYTGDGMKNLKATYISWIWQILRKFLARKFLALIRGHIAAATVAVSYGYIISHLL